MMHRSQLSRRTLLKGMGVLMGLPFLDGMRSVRAGADALRPMRMAVLYMANGVNPHAWTPKGEGEAFELSPILEPLAPFKKDILVLTELWNKATDTGDGHYVKTGGFLTGTTITRTTGSNLCSGGVSMDQIVAQRIGNMTMLPSLELGMEPVNTAVDTNVGYTQLYGGHISWSTPTTPIAKEINPKLAFDRLFRSTLKSTGATADADRSVLDLVQSDAKRLRTKLGAADKHKLDEYFESVRSVEKRIEFDARRRSAEYKEDPLARKAIKELGDRIDFYRDPAHASERGVNHTEHTRLMLDIIALAFWTDSTRVSTFMFGNSVSGKNFSFLEGVSGGHHQISHHENKADKLEEYKRINRWHMAQYAYLLQKLADIKEGESNVLENSMILMGAGMRDGNAHSPHNLPIVLAGRAGGTLKTGRHLVYSKDTPLCNLYRSMLTRMGAPVDSFGDSTGELSNLA